VNLHTKQLFLSDFSAFLGVFFDPAKMANIYEYLAKPGYKPDMKDKSLNIHLDLWLYIKNQIQRFGEFYFSF
jgi:hypothetical protein